MRHVSISLSMYLRLLPLTIILAVLPLFAWGNATSSRDSNLSSFDYPIDWCKRALEKFKGEPGPLDQQIEQDLANLEAPRRVTLVASSELPDGRLLRAVSVPNSQGLLIFEMGHSRPGLDHEMRTAQDYANFVARAYGQQFLYVGDFLSRSVPLFDGVVLSRDLHGLYNVSLKYASVRMKETRIDTLIESMTGRLNYDFDLYGVVRPADWFQKVIARGSLGGVRRHKDYSDYLLRSRLLMNLFELFPNGRPDDQWVPYIRELRTVVDVRDHGYSIEFFLQPEVRNALIELVNSKTSQKLTLTLLWDADHVVEIDTTGIRVHKPN